LRADDVHCCDNDNGLDGEKVFSQQVPELPLRSMMECRMVFILQVRFAPYNDQRTHPGAEEEPVIGSTRR
jgi:hypothetical protein